MPRQRSSDSGIPRFVHSLVPFEKPSTPYGGYAIVDRTDTPIPYSDRNLMLWQLVAETCLECDPFIENQMIHVARRKSLMQELVIRFIDRRRPS